MGEIKPLTSLRGIFAIWVVLFHLRAWSELSDTPIFIIDRGYLGVDFFFMLSGFILAARHGAEFTSLFDFNAHIRFLIKRFGRMFPLHWAVLIFVVVSIRLFDEPTYWWTHIASEAALMHRWDLFYVPRAALNGPDWSISTEWAANIVFPVFIAATGFGQRSAPRSLIIAITFVTTLVLLGWQHGSMDIAEANSILPLVRCFAEFGLGIILFQWKHIFLKLSRDIPSLLLFSVILMGLYLRWDLLVVLTMIPVLPSLALNRNFLALGLSTTPLYFLGTVSYSIYLIQVPVITTFDKLLKASSFAAIGHWLLVFVVIAIAGLTYRLIEKPANQFLRSLSKKVGTQHVAQPLAN